MRILYVTNESPLFPAGGIATYIGYMAEAMRAQGHEVFLLSWHFTDPGPVEDPWPFAPENVRLLELSLERLRAKFPYGQHNLCTAQVLAPEIERLVGEWRIDVVEAPDFLSPALSFFQDWQTRRNRRDLLCVSYNHGFIEDFYEADQIGPKIGTQNDLSGERQQLRASDLVIAPSQVSVRRLASYGIADNVSLVREPYRFARSAPADTLRNAITYMGRISLSKGIDKLVLFANVIDELLPLERVLLIGRKVDTPFRERDIEAYVRNRLSPRLAERVAFTDMLARPEALGLLEPGAIAPCFGSAETFSYACVESIDHGLLPVVRQGTPMAEFFPAQLQHHVQDETFSDLGRMGRGFERLAADAPAVVAELQQVNAEALDPDRIAARMTREYDSALRAKRRYTQVQVQVRRPATLADITVLMPVYRPDSALMETVESLVQQTAGVPRLLICDDGTPQEAQFWFDYARMRIPDCTVLRQPNGGLLAARATLLDRADSRLSLFLDADDILDPRYIDRVLTAYNANAHTPNAVLTQRFNFQQSDEVVLRHLQHDHLHMLRNDYRMTALIETAALRDVGFDITRRNGEADDWVFWLGFAAAGYRAEMVPEPLFRYRFRTGSMSWPWSRGQTIGSLSMVRQALAAMVERRPGQARALSRALFARMSLDE
ncbi:glycosyltransferase [Paroceanicella profunda]|uniref:Glycosyltransferase n=1 Tax=Paroceanicella profunda TaxID=2579971 RepID=A0A5B8FXL8_9RHOB|nr:glycosyltransferase [Paroceanicella profunda]QDL91262.1 glycosyltransferase [Paroceanicella profunda]